jgi:uncharacterized HAD superfamily protein
MRLGIDVDGVLADFNNSFIDRVVQVCKRDLFPLRPFEIPTWDYPQHYGYTDAEIERVWADIKKDPFFWETLPTYPETAQALHDLQKRATMFRDEIYFITSREGKWPKIQTERWLRAKNILNISTQDEFRPTVLVSSDKGACADALELDFYIDDKWSNCTDVAMNRSTGVYMVDRPWNREYHSKNVWKISIVPTVLDMLKELR